VSAEKALHDECQGLLQLTGPQKNLLSIHFWIFRLPLLQPFNQILTIHSLNPNIAQLTY
jgi:hypothetical protein